MTRSLPRGGDGRRRCKLIQDPDVGISTPDHSTRLAVVVGLEDIRLAD
jgi:hypothetical protein